MKQPQYVDLPNMVTTAPLGRLGLAMEFRAHLAAKDRFCDQLEAIADRLPDAVDLRDCLIVAQKIIPMINRAHQFEEGFVFPLILAENAAVIELPEWLERLKFEHLGDEEFASDLSSALRDFATNKEDANIQSLSWMLRGFFEGLRRHVAFERSSLLPLLENHRSP